MYAVRTKKVRYMHAFIINAFYYLLYAIIVIKICVKNNKLPKI